MSQILKSWTKIWSFNLQLSNVLKVTQVSLLSHIRRNHEQQIKDNHTSKTWKEEHKIHLDIFKNLVRSTSTKSYINDDVVKILCKTFTLTPEKFKKVLKLKQFESCTADHLVEIAGFLREMNVTGNHLIRAPWLLWMKREEIETKLSLLRQPFLFQRDLDGLGFTLFEPSLIDRYKIKFESEIDTFSPHQNRIYYLGETLQLPIDLLTLKLAHAWEILHMKRSKLDAVLELLKEYNIPSEEIMNDIWIFRHKVEMSRDRLSKMKEVSRVSPMKLWLCRSPDHNFQVAYNREKRFGSDRTLLQMLQDELNMNEEESIEYVTKGYIDLLKPRNVEHKIRLYKKLGADVEFLRRTPDVLQYSDQRIMERLSTLRAHGIEIRSYALKLNSVKFEQFLNKFSKKSES